MGCPFHGESDEQGEANEDTNEDANAGARTADRGRRRGVDRREFVKAALAIGGVGALARLGDVAGLTANVRAEPDRERASVAGRLNRQHAWDAFEATAPTGNTAQPANSLFLLLDYERPGEPAPGHRRQVGTALDEIERHFEWSSAGVMFTMAYSASYFDRYEADPPPGARPTPPAETAALAEDVTPDEAIRPEDRDAVLLLASDNAANLLAVEEALWGTGDLSFEATFEGVFDRPTEWPDRRAGFAGSALPKEEYAERFDVDVPDEAPLSMGFVAGFGSSVPEEDAVTLRPGQRFPGPDVPAEAVPDADYVGEVGPRDPGAFAQGTLKHLSFLEVDLQQWYDEPEDRRRAQMYSPFHDEEHTGPAGTGLTDDPGGDPDARTDDGEAYPPRDDGDGHDGYARTVPETASDGADATDGEPTTGHSQKSARARYDLDGDGQPEQPCLRRDWDAIAPGGDGGTAGYHFNVPMRYNESIFSLLEATYNVSFTSLDGRVDHDGVPNEEWRDRNGIAPFLSATRRGNFLVPPVTLRALPYPTAADADLAVERDGDRYVVEVRSVDGPGGRAASTPAPDLDPETVRFGPAGLVDRGGGARPLSVDRSGGTVTFTFPTGDGSGDAPRLRLFGELAGTRRPVRATVDG